MPVLVLMYHRTPDDVAEGHFDVSLSDFRAQIQGMIDAGVPFIRFRDCNKEEYLRGGTHVALTFDDGHASNAKAFAFLADRSIVPTAMIVEDWSRNDGDFLSARAIADLRSVCDFGGHGASHVDLTSLDDEALSKELTSSRDYLRDIVGDAVTSMALPGGMGDARVMRAALREGFQIIGNSVPLLHAKNDVSVNRVCVYRQTGFSEPLGLARAGRGYWMRARAKVAVSNYGPRIVGGNNYRSMAEFIKSRLR